MNDLIEEPLEAEGLFSPPTHSLCPSCGSLFPYRSNKTFCSPNCRKAHSKREARRSRPANAAHRRDKARQQYQKYDLAMRMAERLYTMPPGERLGYLEAIIRLARSGHAPLVRDILSTPQLLRANPEDRFLFWRRAPKAYLTITQAANRYCLWSPWAAPVHRVVRGLVPEPPTGEVLPDGTVDEGEPGSQQRGWKRLPDRESVVTLYSRDQADRPSVHPWYGLGDEYADRMRRYLSSEDLREKRRHPL